MKENIINNTNREQVSRLKKCGAITCIHNLDGCCNVDKCEIYERVLKQEY
ncbi:hypothetical protein GOQ27_15750 [Clostridium sp. D2Q-11]|uniref:DUF1540 domain-containing protein n=1 Tax=Anaeromonas frigoriresistens TaxID=2683708 RepID=A0A942ZAM7_9FIRM|nr:hypothetical protein [Anaeromonas frigoriresistens]MBS4539930.1 hypothetical protein [Anaeromonas frigoriresistens]